MSEGGEYLGHINPNRKGLSYLHSFDPFYSLTSVSIAQYYSRTINFDAAGSFIQIFNVSSVPVLAHIHFVSHNCLSCQIVAN